MVTRAETLSWPEAIAAYREYHGLSLEGLARRLGCSAQTVWRWEKGLREPVAYRAQLEAMGITRTPGKESDDE